jgi:hypothetical protein
MTSLIIAVLVLVFGQCLIYILSRDFQQIRSIEKMQNDFIKGRQADTANRLE